MLTTKQLAGEIEALLGAEGPGALGKEERKEYVDLLSAMRKRRMAELAERMSNEERRAREVAEETRATEARIAEIRARCPHKKTSITGAGYNSMVLLRREGGRLFGFCSMVHGRQMCGQRFGYPADPMKGELPITQDLMPDVDSICVVSGAMESLNAPGIVHAPGVEVSAPPAVPGGGRATVSGA